MDKISSFKLPSPVFALKAPVQKVIPHFLTPSGMLQPKCVQPPPMYGPRGSTFPPKYLGNYLVKDKQHQQKVYNDVNNYKLQHNSQIPSIQQEQKNFWHNTCEHKFNSRQQYDYNTKQHKKCGIDNCSFIGNPAVVEKHIEEQHVTGLYEQIKRLESPEDIAKWREERRKRYPSRANVELRQKAREEKLKRGEKLHTNKNRFGDKNNRRGFHNDKNNQQINNRNVRSNRRSKNRNIRSENKTNSVQESNNVIATLKEKQTEETFVGVKSNEYSEPHFSGVKRFRGTGQLEDYKSCTMVESNALSSLICAYGSDDSESDYEDDVNIKDSSESTTELKENWEKSKPLQDISADTGKNDSKNKELTGSIDRFSGNSSDDEAPEEIAIGKSIDLPEPSAESSKQNRTWKSSSEEGKKTSRTRKRSHKTKRSLLDYSKLRNCRQNTMLEKLLQPEIRHERNVLLQCVRFVLQNNFFDNVEKS